MSVCRVGSTSNSQHQTIEALICNSWDLVVVELRLHVQGVLTVLGRSNPGSAGTKIIMAPPK